MDRLKRRLWEDLGLDFSEYREQHLYRRTSRHMRSKGFQDIDTYLTWLSQNPSEYEGLIEVFTIHYTMFFRDPELFDIVSSQVFPLLAERKESVGSRLMRVWCAGCATGEEAYSVGMLLRDFVSKREALQGVVIGTDIDLASLERARRGVFPRESLKSLPIEGRERWFVKRNDLFRIEPSIRQMVRFKLHDLVTDMPLEGMDLIFCRNVLIYFKGALQERIIRKFHDALEAGGILVLGKTDGLCGCTNGLFEKISGREQIFMKNS